MFGSPSRAVVSDRGENVEVLCQNESGRDLLCTGCGGERGLIGDLYAHMRSADVGDGRPLERDAAFAEALENGQLGVFGALVDDGESADIAFGTVSGTSRRALRRRVLSAPASSSGGDR